jgi:hypothetical protein
MPRHRAPDGVDVYHQVLPADFAARLAGLYTEATRSRPAAAIFDHVLAEAHRRGWTLGALAQPLGITRERVRQRTKRNDGAAWCTALGMNLDELIPAPPRLPVPPPPLLRRPDTELSGGMRAWLNDMYQRARKVRGGTPLDHPDRIISETLSAVLADLKYRCRVPASRLADAMGCEEGTVWMRLSRHGYRTLAPSQQPYRRMVARRLARPDPSPGERYEAWVRDQETRQVLGQ